MNDDQIRSELERRAASAASRPDWSKRDLLPAVWREVDARPQPVLTSRWSTGVGVAALVVALLVLVVAVPRLAPQPPAATSTPTDSPTPARYSVLSSQEFVAGMSSGSLLGQTVLVEGHIEEGVTVARGGDPPCLPPSPCTWGSLIASPRWAIYARAVAVPEGTGGTARDGEEWPWWSSPTVPVSGTFVLSVQEEGLVVVGGLVRPSQDGELSLADVAAFDPASVRPDEALLVRGQLVTVGTDFDCHSVPPPPDGLPIRVRACQSTSVIVDADPGDAGTVYVQRDAAAQFGAGEAVYAISPRLYGGYCGDQPPCWLWDVVARIDDAPMPEPTPAPTATPTPSTLPMTHTCAGNGFIQLIDHAGLIESCSTETVAHAGEPIVVSDVSQGVLRVLYSDGCAGASEARLNLWARDDPAWPSQRRYVLAVDAQSPNAPRGCRAAIVGVAVDITFINAGLAPGALASDIEAFMTVDGRGVDVVDRISLEIASGKSVYMEGEAVEVHSSLFSDTDVTLTCPFGPHIVLEQLDGPLSFASGPFILRCNPAKELRAGEKVMHEFSAGGWGYSEPNPLQPYVREGKLYLPPGTYMFSSKSGFGLGDVAPRSELDASVVIRVIPAPHWPAPSATSSPTS